MLENRYRVINFSLVLLCWLLLSLSFIWDTQIISKGSIIMLKGLGRSSVLWLFLQYHVWLEQLWLKVILWKEKCFLRGILVSMNFSKVSFLQSRASWSPLMRKSEEKRWIKNLKYHIEKKSIFDRIPLSKDHLRPFQCGIETKFEVLKVGFFCQALYHMWWHLLRTIISSISIHGSVKPLSYAVGCLKTERIAFTLIPVTKNYKITESEYKK